MRRIAFALLALAAAGPASAQHLFPQALHLSQKETTEELTALSRGKGPVGPAAAKALELYSKLAARERAFILPPLTLLPDLAEGTVTPDMAWALPMTDRVRAEREAIFQEHVRIGEALNELAAAADRARDRDAKEFAESVSADSLADLEINEPALLIIGDLLRAKLSAAH
jgi:hypothetical protein